uniref:Protein kinase domain-containing protein n=2 Tax=Amphimedon queenslandica TaxID=400682 RepID=A0A1X7VWX9_AMPQE
MSNLDKARYAYPFDLLQCIVNEEPPKLREDMFSPLFIDFISLCMQKLVTLRPGIKDLLSHEFLKCDDHNENFVSQWLIQTMEQVRITKHSSSNVILNSISNPDRGRVWWTSTTLSDATFYLYAVCLYQARLWQLLMLLDWKQYFYDESYEFNTASKFSLFETS